MDNKSNPAQNLYDICRKINESFQELSTNNKRPMFFEVWAKAFNIDKINGQFSLEEQLQIISRVNQTRQLVDKVEEILLKNDKINHQKYLKAFPNIRSILPYPFQFTNPFTTSISEVSRRTE